MSELIDNSRRRIEALKGMILRLHDGEPAEALREEFGGLLDEVGASEIAAMESELIAGGLAETEVRRMCDVHAAVLASGRATSAPADAPPGHPVHTFRLENDRIRKMLATYRRAVGAFVSDPGPDTAAAWAEAQADLDRVDGHYLRKEYLVFPFLERAGIAGPPKVMWGVHDEIRERLAAARELAAGAAELDHESATLVLETVVAPLLDQVEGMVDKEERVLWPMALEHLTPAQWGDVQDQWSDLGEPLARPAGLWLPVRAAVPEHVVDVPGGEAIRLPSGHLSLRQLTALLDTLPVDLTFVDADGRVAWFSEGADRIFVRNRAVLGRRVEDCHPPKSIHLVRQVVDELRSGARDVAEFWIEMGPRFVHIRYFAVRDQDGAFLGTLEVTQDLAPLRALSGERRLLDEAGPGGVA